MRIFIFLSLITLPAWLLAQTEPQQSSLPNHISAIRQELRTAFSADDPAGAGLWMDSLARLENDQYTGLIWDERWLLYYWQEAYGNLFDEVVRFDAAEQERQAGKIAPRGDSLFETIDRTLYERRFALFNRLQQGFLTQEEKAFAALQLDYLLRLNLDQKEWTARLDAFLQHYPASRFANFIRSIRPGVVPVEDHPYGFGGALGFTTGQWTNQANRSLLPLYGAELSVYRWIRGWHYEVEILTGIATLDQDVFHHGFQWPKAEQAHFLAMGLEAGRELFNTSGLRITPSLGAYFSALDPVTPQSGENPDYYAEFFFPDVHLAAVLTTDLKLFREDRLLAGSKKGSFHGIRFRAGYHWLRLGKRNPAFAGNLFFITVGYQIFRQQP